MTKKARCIEELTSLSTIEKEKAISFFNKYPCYENRIDWNNKSLQYNDFEKVFIIAENSHNSIARKAKINPELLFEGYNCQIVYQSLDLLVVVPIDWECAVFINSFNCGGSGARWCIGDKNNRGAWYNYIDKGDIFYLFYFIKTHPIFGRKILLQCTGFGTIASYDFLFWNTEDEWVDGELFNGLREIYDKIQLPKWYNLLRCEKKANKQLFFDFDIFHKYENVFSEIMINKFISTYHIYKSIENNIRNFWHEKGTDILQMFSFDVLFLEIMILMYPEEVNYAFDVSTRRSKELTEDTLVS
jgi:hypothetical protein